MSNSKNTNAMMNGTNPTPVHIHCNTTIPQYLTDDDLKRIGALTQSNLCESPSMENYSLTSVKLVFPETPTDMTLRIITTITKKNPEIDSQIDYKDSIFQPLLSNLHLTDIIPITPDSLQIIQSTDPHDIFLSIEDIRPLFKNFPLHIITEQHEFKTQNHLAIHLISGKHFYGYTVIFWEDPEKFLEDLLNIANGLDLNEGHDDQYFDYSPDTLEALLYGYYVLKQNNINPENLLDILIKKLREYQKEQLINLDREPIDLYYNLLNNLNHMGNYSEDLFSQITNN